MKKYILALIMALLSATAFSQTRYGSYEPNKVARDTLELINGITGEFVVSDTTILPLQIFYAQFSPDGENFHRFYEQGYDIWRISTNSQLEWDTINFRNIVPDLDSLMGTGWWLISDGTTTDTIFNTNQLDIVSLSEELDISLSGKTVTFSLNLPAVDSLLYYYAQNVGTGVPIYDSTTGGNYFNFRSISGDEFIDVTLNSQTINVTFNPEELSILAGVALVGGGTFENGTVNLDFNIPELSPTTYNSEHWFAVWDSVTNQHYRVQLSLEEDSCCFDYWILSTCVEVGDSLVCTSDTVFNNTEVVLIGGDGIEIIHEGNTVIINNTTSVSDTILPVGGEPGQVIVTDSTGTSTWIDICEAIADCLTDITSVLDSLENVVGEITPPNLVVTIGQTINTYINYTASCTLSVSTLLSDSHTIDSYIIDWYNNGEVSFTTTTAFDTVVPAGVYYPYIREISVNSVYYSPVLGNMIYSPDLATILDSVVVTECPYAIAVVNTGTTPEGIASQPEVEVYIAQGDSLDVGTAVFSDPELTVGIAVPYIRDTETGIVYTVDTGVITGVFISETVTVAVVTTWGDVYTTDPVTAYADRTGCLTVGDIVYSDSLQTTPLLGYYLYDAECNVAWAINPTTGEIISEVVTPPTEYLVGIGVRDTDATEWDVTTWFGSCSDFNCSLWLDAGLTIPVPDTSAYYDGNIYGVAVGIPTPEVTAIAVRVSNTEDSVHTADVVYVYVPYGTSLDTGVAVFTYPDLINLVGYAYLKDVLSGIVYTVVGGELTSQSLSEVSNAVYYLGAGTSDLTLGDDTRTIKITEMAGYGSAYFDSNPFELVFVSEDIINSTDWGSGTLRIQWFVSSTASTGYIVLDTVKVQRISGGVVVDEFAVSDGWNITSTYLDISVPFNFTSGTMDDRLAIVFEFRDPFNRPSIGVFFSSGNTSVPSENKITSGFSRYE